MIKLPLNNIRLFCNNLYSNNTISFSIKYFYNVFVGISQEDVRLSKIGFLVEVENKKPRVRIHLINLTDLNILSVTDKPYVVMKKFWSDTAVRLYINDCQAYKVGIELINPIFYENEHYTIELPVKPNEFKNVKEVYYNNLIAEELKF